MGVTGVRCSAVLFALLFERTLSYLTLPTCLPAYLPGGSLPVPFPARVVEMEQSRAEQRKIK